MIDSPPAQPHDDSRIRAIRERLAAHAAGESDAAESPADPYPGLTASVALLVRPRPSDLELLLIRRAVYEGDPWSGHVALPGGRHEPRDRTRVDTAIRETLEEVGIDLAGNGTSLGVLEEVRPRAGGPPASILPCVFAVPADTVATPNYEVESALWVPTGRLADPAAAVEHVHTLPTGELARFPAIAYGEYVIWGLTHRILSRFLEITRARS